MTTTEPVLVLMNDPATAPALPAALADLTNDQMHELRDGAHRVLLDHAPPEVRKRCAEIEAGSGGPAATYDRGLEGLTGTLVAVGNLVGDLIAGPHPGECECRMCNGSYGDELVADMRAIAGACRVFATQLESYH